MQIGIADRWTVTKVIGKGLQIHTGHSYTFHVTHIPWIISKVNLVEAKNFIKSEIWCVYIQIILEQRLGPVIQLILLCIELVTIMEHVQF